MGAQPELSASRNVSEKRWIQLLLEHTVTDNMMIVSPIWMHSIKIKQTWYAAACNALWTSISWGVWGSLCAVVTLVKRGRKARISRWKETMIDSDENLTATSTLNNTQDVIDTSISDICHSFVVQVRYLLVTFDLLFYNEEFMFAQIASSIYRTKLCQWSWWEDFREWRTGISCCWSPQSGSYCRFPSLAEKGYVITRIQDPQCVYFPDIDLGGGGLTAMHMKNSCACEKVLILILCRSHRLQTRIMCWVTKARSESALALATLFRGAIDS